MPMFRRTPVRLLLHPGRQRLRLLLLHRDPQLLLLPSLLRLLQNSYGMELRIAEIMRILPHRYPFLLVDRVIEVDPDKRIVALKNVTINEPFFAGHFPGAPVMPGVLTIEAIAQAGAILGLLEKNADLSKTVIYFMGIDEAKFRRPI